MPTGTSAERAQSCYESYNVVFELPGLRRALPGQPSCQRSPRYIVHLRTTKLSPCIMPAQHRPLLALRHGSFRCRWTAGRYTLPLIA